MDLRRLSISCYQTVGNTEFSASFSCGVGYELLTKGYSDIFAGKSQMTKRFGLGFETNSGASPSTQRARAFFLELLPQLKAEVVPALFETARQPFLEFLTDSRDKILSIDSDLESSTEPTDTAVRLFISSYAVLRRQKKAAALRSALQKWANDWNLTDDWCMDYAVAVLREQHLGTLDAYDAWHESVTIQLELDSVCVQGAFNEEFSKRCLDKFSFTYEEKSFTIEGPMFMSIPEFKQEVERTFEAAGVQYIRGGRTALKHKLDEYLKKVNKVKEELSFMEATARPSESHFEWLVRYQIPPVMRYREIGRHYGRDEKTVRDGVQDVAKLIGLKLRSPEEDKHPGRPKGAKDKNKRFRASSR